MSSGLGPNRALLLAVARRFDHLVKEVVFVGGQVAELLITSPGATRIRPTVDVDVVVEASTRIEYQKLEARLKDLGIRHDSREGAPLCRWLTPENIGIDIMPPDPSVLGFTNRWYELALSTSVDYSLADDISIRIPTAPVFLGTKWEAFHQRGGRDMLASHDLEDIISVVAGRPEITDEVRAAPRHLSEYLGLQSETLLQDESVRYALQGALPDSAQLPELIGQVLGRFTEISVIGNSDHSGQESD